MILECPSCHARYMVQIGLFAQGGRQVRCARCKHEWHAKLPTSIDVFSPPPPPPVMPPIPVFAPPGTASASGEPPAVTPNLPAIIDNWKWGRRVAMISGGVVLFLLLAVWPILDRQQIAQVLPGLRGFYEALGLSITSSGNGLIFDQVKSELRYDGGTMHLYVDGIIHNATTEMQLIPDIKARALGPDQRIIQSWWVAAPAASVAAGSDVPFHTEVNAPMKRTIENVYLEFYAQDEKGDVVQ